MPSKKQAVLETGLFETPDIPVCQHHWVIDSPAGPVSQGTCRLCGEEREFQNYIEGSSWGYDVSLEQLAGGIRLPGGVKNTRTQDGAATDEE
ncbi:MAG: hypothetical protein QF467_04615 [SAR202 cluster bacterium]|nr:hypothetical protein [SAR202 cluster bacterium]